MRHIRSHEAAASCSSHPQELSPCSPLYHVIWTQHNTASPAAPLPEPDVATEGGEGVSAFGFLSAPPAEEAPVGEPADPPSAFSFLSSAALEAVTPQVGPRPWLCGGPLYPPLLR
jgi:hypothetical protein